MDNQGVLHMLLDESYRMFIDKQIDNLEHNEKISCATMLLVNKPDKHFCSNCPLNFSKENCRFILSDNKLL